MDHLEDPNNDRLFSISDTLHWKMADVLNRHASSAVLPGKQIRFSLVITAGSETESTVIGFLAFGLDALIFKVMESSRFSSSKASVILSKTSSIFSRTIVLAILASHAGIIIDATMSCILGRVIMTGWMLTVAIGGNHFDWEHLIG